MYFALYSTAVRATGHPAPWYLPLQMAVYGLRFLFVWNVVPAVGFVLLIIGLFRLVRSLRESRKQQ
jgi:hypothetical protein